jgi:hypothetical protein
MHGHRQLTGVKASSMKRSRAPVADTSPFLAVRLALARYRRAVRQL